MTVSSVADAYWLLTARAEVRRRPPHEVGLGSAAAAMTDLLALSEVTWARVDDDDAIRVHSSCTCPDGTMRAWHAALSAATDDGTILVRFCLDPLIPDAWRDTAHRLVGAGAATAQKSVFPLSRLRYRPTDPHREEAGRGSLDSGIRAGSVSDLQRLVVSAAWASDSFDDLFRPHGITVSDDLRSAAAELVADDPWVTRLSTALSSSRTIPFSSGSSG